MVTLEDIEKELDPSRQDGYAAKLYAKALSMQMNKLIKKLKTQESLTSPEIVKSLILGKRKLTAEEYAASIKKFGLTGVKSIEVMEHLSTPQKQYIFKRMGYDISEVE
ncbi:MAG: hypothetical protein PHV83_05355 [Bacteroidales bacterium]|nr:hypothetical protein [Bacteroidales bacterium]